MNLMQHVDEPSGIFPLRLNPFGDSPQINITASESRDENATKGEQQNPHHENYLMAQKLGDLRARDTLQNKYIQIPTNSKALELSQEKGLPGLSGPNNGNIGSRDMRSRMQCTDTENFENLEKRDILGYLDPEDRDPTNPTKYLNNV